MKTKKITNNKQIGVLEKIAKNSKMDSWFSIDEQGYVRDLEDNNKVLPTKGGIKQLLDGLTIDDCGTLTKEDVYYLIDTMIDNF